MLLRVTVVFLFLFLFLVVRNFFSRLTRPRRFGDTRASKKWASRTYDVNIREWTNECMRVPVHFEKQSCVFLDAVVVAAAVVAGTAAHQRDRVYLFRARFANDVNEVRTKTEHFFQRTGPTTYVHRITPELSSLTSRWPTADCTITRVRRFFNSISSGGEHTRSKKEEK